MIVLCYVGARDHVIQCVGHVLCGSSLWSCESVWFSSVFSVLYVLWSCVLFVLSCNSV